MEISSLLPTLLGFGLIGIRLPRTGREAHSHPTILRHAPHSRHDDHPGYSDACFRRRGNDGWIDCRRLMLVLALAGSSARAEPRAGSSGTEVMH